MIERCPECGGIDYAGTVRHVARYLTSSRYRKACKKAEDWAYLLDRLINKTYIQDGDTIHIPKLERLTSEEPEAP